MYFIIFTFLENYDNISEPYIERFIVLQKLMLHKQFFHRSGFVEVLGSNFVVESVNGISRRMQQRGPERVDGSSVVRALCIGERCDVT